MITGHPDPLGHRESIGEADTDRVLLGFSRLLVSTAAGLLVIPGMIAHSGAVLAVAGIVLLANALVVDDLVRPGRRGWTFVVGMHGAGAGVLVAIIAALGSWSVGLWTGGTAAVLFFLQAAAVTSWRGRQDRRRLEGPAPDRAVGLEERRWAPRQGQPPPFVRGEVPRAGRGRDAEHLSLLRLRSLRQQRRPHR